MLWRGEETEEEEEGRTPKSMGGNKECTISLRIRGKIKEK